MPKLVNTIQFSLDLETRETLSKVANPGESLGLCAKRLVLESLGGNTTSNPVSNDFEEKFKAIEERFNAMVNQISELSERVKTLESSDKTPSDDLTTVLSAIRELDRKIDQSNEVIKLRALVKMQQEEINNQQDKLATREFDLRQEKEENDQLRAMYLELKKSLDDQKISAVALDENLLAPPETDQPVIFDGDLSVVDPEVDPSQDTTPVSDLEIVDQPDQPLEAQNFIESPPEDDNVQNHQQPEEVITVLYTRDELEAKSRDELKVLATDLGLYVSSKKIKSELIKMILDHKPDFQT